LCRNLINRKLFRIELKKTPFEANYSAEIRTRIQEQYHLSPEELPYFFVEDEISNMAYAADQLSINILMKNGQICDIAEASDTLNISALSSTVKKYFICYPKGD
jgi:uncharacterized protein